MEKNGKNVIKLFTRGGTEPPKKKIWPESLNSYLFVKFDSRSTEVSKGSNWMVVPKEHALRGCMHYLKATMKERQVGVRPEEIEHEAPLEMSHISLNW